MNIKVMTVTPKMAAEFLKKVDIAKQRKLSERLVDTYAQTMRNGKWVLTHQGIAFDKNGNLCDGQHRMQAVVKSGVTIQVIVSTDVDEMQKGVFTFDAIDRGVPRSIGDQLNVRHGIKNANIVAAACRCIGIICKRTMYKATVENTLSVYERFGDNVEYCVSALHSTPALRNASIIGTLAFCQRAMHKQVTPFIDSVSSGENICAGDPAYTLRNFVLSGGSHGAGAGVLGRGERQTALAAMRYVLGEKVKQLKLTSSGLDFFADKQSRTVEELRVILS
jgi:hypothetical protein